MAVKKVKKELEILLCVDTREVDTSYVKDILDDNNKIRTFKDSSCKEGLMKPISKTGTYNIGNIFITNENFKIKIIEKIDYEHYVIEFQDEHKFKTIVGRCNIFSGSIKNPYNKSVYGIGYIGEVGTFFDIKEKNKIYYIWSKMIKRCYDKKSMHKNPTYKNVTVCDEWLCFANFLNWYQENHIKDFELDKDLLQQGVKNKIYSPTTCIFLPKYINIYLASKKIISIDYCTGVNFSNIKNKFQIRYNDFDERKEIHLGYADSFEEAMNIKIPYFYKVREQVRNHMRKLNCWSEDIIQLVGCDLDD